jgi:hypothetical protein
MNEGRLKTLRKAPSLDHNKETHFENCLYSIAKTDFYTISFAQKYARQYRLDSAGR